MEMSYVIYIIIQSFTYEYFQYYCKEGQLEFIFTRKPHNISFKSRLILRCVNFDIVVNL